MAKILTLVLLFVGAIYIACKHFDAERAAHSMAYHAK